MAFRARDRKAARSEIELLRGLITLANQLQADLELDEVVRVIAAALSETFGFREATVYLSEPGDVFVARAVVGLDAERDRVAFERPVPRRIWDELFLEKHQVGSSFFVDHRRHSWTEEQQYYLPDGQLGRRGVDEWQAEDGLFVPLRAQDELVGVLDLYDPADRARPTLDLIKALEVFATHAAVAIQNARRYAQLAETTEQLEAQLALSHQLLSAGGAVLSSLEETEVLEYIADTLKQIVDYDTMDIRLVDGDHRRLVALYARDAENGQAILDFAIPMDEGLSGWVVRHNEAQLVNDMASDPRGVFIPGTEEDEQQACILLPLSIGDAVIGVMTMDRLGGRVFEERELEPARLFANMAANAIRNARQYDEIESTSTKLETQLALRHELMDLSTLLLSSLDQREVFTRIAVMLKHIVDYDSMDVRLLDEDARELVCSYSRLANAELNQQFRLSIDEGVSGWVARHNEAQLVDDMTADPRGVHLPGTENDVRQASIIVPLAVRGKVTGVLCLDRLGGRIFEPAELEPVQLFANLAAIAIQNARTYEQMERQAISDGLTGIHNYRHFTESLAAEVARAGRYGEHFCLLMMDLDHFKAVNDTIGHQKGDDVLRAVAGVLRACSRESDYLARYGGEEFAMILPRTELDEAARLAERIRVATSALDPGHPDLHVTMSIGIASYPESAPESDGVLAASDAALLRAKTHGRDRVCLAGDGALGWSGVLDGDLVGLGRRFAAFIGLNEAETAGLITALAVHETGSASQGEIQEILGGGTNGDTRPNEVRRSAVDALVYGNERWDGAGYPEGRRGSAIPRVARAFAVCRRFDAAHNGHSVAELRERAAHELDPTMVQRFAAMLRAGEGAEHN